MVSPPPDASRAAALGTAPSRPSGAAAPPDSPANKAGASASIPPDLPDIRPLDLAGALQILIAEVRAELTQVLLQGTDNPASEMGGGSGPMADTVLPAARDILEAALSALPQSSPDVAVWAAALPPVEAAVATGLARAASIIESWRAVPEAVLSGAQSLRALVGNALSDEALNPIWLRPEWLNLAPRLMQLRRRRKFLQRRLTDPDFRPSFFDDLEPLT